MYYGSQRPSMARRAFKFAILTTFTFTLCFASSEKIMEGQIEPGEIQEVQSETIIMPAAFSAAGTPFRETFLLRQDPLLLDGPTVTERENTIVTKNETAEFSPNNSAEETTTPAPEELEPERENIIYRMVTESEEGQLAVEYQDYLWEICKKYDVTEYYTLFLAQMWHESRYETDVISKTNDYGLAQINVCNHDWLSDTLGVTDFLNPYQGIECCVYIMSDYLNKYNDVQMALVCYNRGESAVKNGTYSTSYSRCIINDMNCLVEVEN